MRTQPANAPGARRWQRALSRTLLLLVISPVMFGAAETRAGGDSGLPLPRFVSLKSSRVNMRVGPGPEYQVEWMYVKRGLPVEIVQEYDNWRKVRDAEGNEGWVLGSLLSGDRTAIVAPWNEKSHLVEMHAAPQAAGTLVARIEPGAIARVQSCENSWCKLEADGITGFVRQNQLWGVYPEEPVSD